MRHIFYLLRPQQWIKNLFIFLPLIFGKKLLDFPENFYTIIAFCLFSLTASVIYIINDIADIERDKIHPMKRLRPIPSGKVSIKKAYFVAAILSVFVLPLAFALNSMFGLILIIYIALNLLYSKFFKDAIIIDVFCIAFFFLLRIIAGSITANVSMSHWMIFMIALLALFLGFNKRRQEIILLSKKAGNHREVLKKYSIYFIDQISSIITASLVVVYMLYVVDTRTVSFFGTSNLMYTIPFVYYGIFRYMYILHGRRWQEGDPTRIVLKDKKMQLNIMLWIAVCIAVIYFGL
jgi:4-hydroxybenzoate polyprenyltransferase